MPFSVFSWNVHRLSGKSSRLADVERVIERHKPDLIFLSETSHDMKLPGYVEIGHALSISKMKAMGDTGKVAHNQLNTKLFQRADSTVKIIGARSLRQAPGQPRGMIKLSVKDKGQVYSMDFLHAKAGKEGGAAALAESIARLKAGDTDAVLGDLNHNIAVPEYLAMAEAEGLKVIRPLDTMGRDLKETHKSSASESLLDFTMARGDTKVRGLKLRVDTRERPQVDARLGKGGRYSLRRVPKRFVRLSDHRPTFVRFG